MHLDLYLQARPLRLPLFAVNALPCNVLRQARMKIVPQAQRPRIEQAGFNFPHYFTAWIQTHGEASSGFWKTLHRVDG